MPSGYRPSDIVDRSEQNRLIERYGGGDLGRRKLDEQIAKYSHENNQNWDDPRVGITTKQPMDKIQEAYVHGGLAQATIESAPELVGIARMVQNLATPVLKMKPFIGPGTYKGPLANWAIESGFRMLDAHGIQNQHDEEMKKIREMTWNYSPEEYTREMQRPLKWDPDRSPMPERFSTPPQPRTTGQFTHDLLADVYGRYARPMLQALPSSMFAAHDWIRSTLPTSMGGRYDDETPMDYQMRTGLMMDPMGTYQYANRPKSWRPLNPKENEDDLLHLVRLLHKDLDKERDDRTINDNYSL